MRGRLNLSVHICLLLAFLMYSNVFKHYYTLEMVKTNTTFWDTKFMYYTIYICASVLNNNRVSRVQSSFSYRVVLHILSFTNYSSCVNYAAEKKEEVMSS